MSNKDKKTVGRPRKFDEKVLLQAVKNYVKKNNDHPTRLKVTKIAEYFKSIGVNVNYQDLKRYKEVNDYIEKFNETYKKLLFAQQDIPLSVDEDSDMPIYEKVDYHKLIKTNKASKELESAINQLNDYCEKLTISHGNMKDKLVNQSEKIIKQHQQIEDLQNSITLLTNDYQRQIDELKLELKECEDKYRKSRKEMAIYDEFINRYHYDALAQYALSLEGKLDAKMECDFAIFDEEAYKSGMYSLRDVIGAYQDVLLSAENAMLKQDMANDTIATPLTGTNEDVSEESSEKEITDKSIFDDVGLDDMEKSLSEIFSE